MTTLTIKDLAVVEELDQKAMAAMVGGNKIVDQAFDVAKIAWGLMTGDYIGAGMGVASLSLHASE